VGESDIEGTDSYWIHTLSKLYRFNTNFLIEMRLKWQQFITDE